MPLVRKQLHTNALGRKDGTTTDGTATDGTATDGTETDGAATDGTAMNGAATAEEDVAAALDRYRDDNSWLTIGG